MIAKARVAQLTGLPSITAAAEGPVTFGCFFYRWKARLLSGWGSSLAQGTGGRVRAPAPTAYPKVRLIFCRARCPHRAIPRRPSVPPLRNAGIFRFGRRGRRPRRPAGAHCAPLRRKTDHPPESFPSSVWPTASHPPLTFGRPQGPPLRRKWTGSVDWAKPGAAVEPHQSQFSTQPGPSGPEEIAECHSDFARRKGCAMFKG